MGKLTVIGSGSKGNGYILDDGSNQLIIELGCRFEEYLKALDYKIDCVGGCLVTHRLPTFRPRQIYPSRIKASNKRLFLPRCSQPI